MSYYKLNTLCTIRELILKFCTDQSNNGLWFNKHGFEILSVPLEIAKQDSTIKYFVDNFNAHPVIFKMQPNSFYRFHIDATRQCTLNSLLLGEDSNFYFGEQGDSEEVIIDVIEMKYHLNHYYLLNTKVKHAVYNKGNTRYMLSIGIDNYDYETVLQKYKNTATI